MALRIGMVTADCADPKALSAFWAAALQTSVVFEVEGFVMLAPPAEGGPALGFQLVPEERAAAPTRSPGWWGSAPPSSGSAAATSTAWSGRR